jgi:hypothetical protein
MMSDKPFTLDLPEELIARAHLAHIDLRRVMIEALRREVDFAEVKSTQPPSAAMVEQAVQESIVRMENAPETGRVLGLHEGRIWMSDDFDDPLPDAFWLDGDP